MTTNNWAILIGINQYNFLEPLQFAKADTEAMRSCLKDEFWFEKLFLFSENSPPIQKVNPPIITQPTFGNLDAFFDAQFDKPPTKNPPDHLWFFFSGHGMRGKDGDYLMLSDSNPRRISQTAIAVNYITERLRNWGAKNVVMFIDACRSEAGGTKGEQIQTTNYQGIITFYSCSVRERSYEIEHLKKGAFTYVLLEALRLGKNQSLTVGKLEEHLMEKVPLLDIRHCQHPLAKVEPTDKRNLILLNIPQQPPQPEIELFSDRKVDYTNLKELLSQGKWREADEETLQVMLKASGQEKKGYLDYEDIHKFSCRELRTIDQLWRKLSNEHFGFSIQNHLWKSCGGQARQNYNERTWEKFGYEVGWYVKDNQGDEEWLGWNRLNFTVDAPKGHLPWLALWWMGVGSGCSQVFTRVEICEI